VCEIYFEWGKKYRRIGKGRKDFRHNLVYARPKHPARLIQKILEIKREEKGGN